MKLRIDDIREKGRHLSVSEPIDFFPSLAALAAEGEVRFLTPLRAELDLAWEYDHIRVAGTVATSVELDCSLCLAKFTQDVSSDVTMLFTKALPGQTAADEDEVELGERELITIPFVGDELDLAPEMAEQVIMELPLKPLCSPDCHGLCPQCGENLNLRTCDCERAPVNFKMAALKNFKVEP